MQSFTYFVIITFQFGTLLAAPEVLLPNGPIRGREATTFRNSSFYAFEKIPYASPPIGELRFKAPVPPSNWEEPLDTLYLDVICYQQASNSASESEDCLYLNVFTPELPTEAKNVSLPVMLFIHGGGFVGGSGRTYGDRFIDEGVLFVAINYRLGPFGFLSTEDEVIPGNNGLKDQHLAIKWVHDNIQLFGGDPDKITIFGQSAGSASCTYQLLNQESTGLFRGAILQSGTFLSPWSFQRRAKEIAFVTAALLNDTFSTNRNSQDLLDFLQRIDAKDLDTASELYYNMEVGPDTQILQGYYWAPVVETKNPNAFLTRKMYGLLEAGSIVPVPVLMGMNSEEGISFSQKYFPDPESFKANMEQYDQNLARLVPNDMRVTDVINRTSMGSKIRDIYTNGEPLADHLGDSQRYYSDTSFTRPIIKHAELYSKLAETYFYQFSYDGTLGVQNVYYEGAEKVGHDEEKAYLFCGGTDCDLSKYPVQDQITADRLIKIWSNFAKYQNPTPETTDLLQNISWPLVSIDDGDFLYVDISENLEIMNQPKKSTYGTWTELYDSLGYTDFDTY